MLVASSIYLITVPGRECQYITLEINDIYLCINTRMLQFYPLLHLILNLGIRQNRVHNISIVFHKFR